MRARNSDLYRNSSLRTGGCCLFSTALHFGTIGLSRPRDQYQLISTTSVTQNQMEPLDLFTLDTRSGVRLSYLAEGAANIVYRPILPPTSPSTETDFNFPVAQPHGVIPATPPPTETPTITADPRLEGTLIRLRKDLSTTVPVTESWAHFHNVVSPLFLDSQLVSQTLFHISRTVIHSLNAELRAMERDGRRPEKRHGVYVDDSEIYGTLVPDMSSDARSMSVEFKPKWLVQSPNAPEGSKRCRTCALRAMKAAKARTSRSARDAEDGRGGFCPLNLVSGDRCKVSTVVEQLLGSSRFSDLDRMRVGDQLMRWLPKSLLLQRLTHLQDTLDPVGVLEADLEAQAFLTAMTLRDCTLFLKVRWPAPGGSLYADIFSGICRSLVPALGRSRRGSAIWISSPVAGRKLSIGGVRRGG